PQHLQFPPTKGKPRPAGHTPRDLEGRATTTALKRLFENNSTTNKDIIKPFSDLKSTHFILPPLRFSHSSSFYHRSWCENRPFFPPLFGHLAKPHQKSEKHTQTKTRSTSPKSYRLSSNLWQQAQVGPLYLLSNFDAKRSNS